MRLWLLCCIFLFGATQLYDWGSHQAWLAADLSLPWVLLGGVGLAIASNRTTLKKTFRKTPEAVSPLSEASQVPKGGHQATTIEAAAISVDKPPQPPDKSISFEIPKRRRSRD